MHDDSPKKFDRIVAILIQLQSKKIVRAQELANRFQVSLRTIYRDIRTLEQSGVPLYGEAGHGYSLVDGYRLPPVMFSRDEAASFIAAEKLVQKFTDDQLRRDFESALFKLKAVLNSEEKQHVEKIANGISLWPGPDHSAQKAPNALTQILKGIGQKTQMDIRYERPGANSPSSRRIEPVGLFHENTHWYVLGFCHLRQDYRRFRTDRIQHISVTDEPFTRTHQPLEAYLVNPSDTVAIRIQVQKAVAPYILDEARHHGLLRHETKEEWVEMDFLCRHAHDGFARWFLMFADCARILWPESVHNRVRELLASALRQQT